MGRTNIVDLNPNGKFLNPGASIIGSSQYIHPGARGAPADPAQQQADDYAAQEAQQQAQQQAQDQAAANAQKQDYRNRVLFGDKGADLLSLSIPGYMPPRGGDRDRDTGLPRFGKGTPRTSAKAFVVGDKTKANPTGEEVVITEGPSMVIPKTAFTKGKAFGNLPPKRDGKTGFPKFGNGGIPNDDNLTLAQMSALENGPISVNGVAQPVDGLKLTTTTMSGSAGKGSGSAFSLPSQPTTTAPSTSPAGQRSAFGSTPASTPPPTQQTTSPTGPRSAFAPQPSRPKWGSSLARNYKPIGHDYDPGGNMEQTETGSFRHGIKMRRTDERRFLRAPQGVAFQMQEQSRDRAFDRHDAARRDSMQTQRGWEQEDRATAKTEREAAEAEEAAKWDAVGGAMTEGGSLLNEKDLAILQAAKGSKAKEAVFDSLSRLRIGEREDSRRTEATAAERKQAEEDFFSFSDVPGSPGYQMNRRGQTFRKGEQESPAAGWRDLGNGVGYYADPQGNPLPTDQLRQRQTLERQGQGVLKPEYATEEVEVPFSESPKYEQDKDKKWFRRDPNTGRPIYEDQTPTPKTDAPPDARTSKSGVRYQVKG